VVGDFVGDFGARVELPATQFVSRIGIGRGKYPARRQRYGRANEQQRAPPQRLWLTDEGRQHVIAYHDRFPLEGYRLPTSLMLDEDVVAARPAIVCGVLCAAGLLDRWNRQPFKEGSSFVQPLQPHQH
jgi:hypothetical protein